MINRYLKSKIISALGSTPVVAIVGSRQVGKSTLAKELLAQQEGSVYLDLEKPEDLTILENAARYFRDNINALICLDEVQRKPEIFPLLRSIIDEHNRKPRFLILGSASPDLLKQSSESLAGRIRYFELSPFNYSEINQIELSTFWLRGGYPLSFLSGTDQASYEWRESFISTYLERDLPNLGFRRTSALVRRVWAMLAHYHGQILNKSKLSQSLDLTSQAITGYLDMLADTYMIRVIEPYYSNSKKRLVKTPKVYIRDSGILHYLLKIKTREDLYSNPNYGSSWEGLVVENILSMINQSWDVFFYRNSLGDELDLVLKYGSKIIAIECKSSSAPKLTKSNYSAISDIKPEMTYVVAPIEKAFNIDDRIRVCNIGEIVQELTSI